MPMSQKVVLQACGLYKLSMQQGSRDRMTTDFGTCCRQLMLCWVGHIAVPGIKFPYPLTGRIRRCMARRSEMWRRSMHSRRHGAPWVPQPWHSYHPPTPAHSQRWSCARAACCR
jgi:hypothetical protein